MIVIASALPLLLLEVSLYLASQEVTSYYGSYKGSGLASLHARTRDLFLLHVGMGDVDGVLSHDDEITTSLE